MNIAKLIDGNIRSHPKRLWYIFITKERNTEITYGELTEASDRLGNALRGLGVRKGDRIGLYLPLCPEWTVCYLGILKIGATLVLMNSMLKAREAEHIVADSGACIIITDQELVQNIAPFKAELSELRGLRDIIVVGERHDEGDMSFHNLLEKSSPRLSITKCVANDIAYIVYTSGTTGVPKGAMLSHGALRWCAEEGLSKTYRFVKGERVMSHGVLSHIGGLSHTLLSLYKGCTSIASPRMTPTEDYLINIYRYGATFAMGIHVFLSFYLSHPEAERYLGTVSRVLDGGGPLPYAISHEFEQRFGIPVVDLYGLTESAIIGAYYPPEIPRKPGACGIASPGAKIKIVDDDENELPPGQNGEICLRGPFLISGYWNMPEETEKALKGGWLHTGDIGHLDDDGHLFVTDRKKDIILSNIWSIYPREVEDVLHTYPKIGEAAVIGVPDPIRFEKVTAIVALKSGETATEQEIIKFCKERMAAYKCPQSVIFVDALPRSIGGMKVSRKELREIYMGTHGD